MRPFQDFSRDDLPWAHRSLAKGSHNDPKSGQMLHRCVRLLTPQPIDVRRQVHRRRYSYLQITGVVVMRATCVSRSYE